MNRNKKSLLVAATAASMFAGCGMTVVEQAQVDSAQPAIEVDHAEIVYIWMEGDFDSTQQSASNSDYHTISLRMCTVELPDLGPRILYVEQAVTSSLGAPYRQRLYSIEAVDGRVASRVFSMSDELEADLVGACDAQEINPIDVDQVVERLGCTVWLEPDGNERYVGGTEGSDCTSTMSGASYATSEVIVEPLRISSWDRGWGVDEQQVWGATSGPYEFARVD
jgi:hypothetical protein